jgi:hypothetical protein
VFVLGLVALGCGGGDDDSSATAPSGLAGMYQTMTTTVSEPCDAAAMPADNDPPYFQIKDEQFFGQSYIGLYPCTDPDPSSCDSFAEIDFATPAGAGTYRSKVTGLSTDGSAAPTECNGDYSVSEIKKTSEGVSVVSSEQSGLIMGAELCKFGEGEFTAQQKAAIQALACTSRETRQAQRL